MTSKIYERANQPLGVDEKLIKKAAEAMIGDAFERFPGRRNMIEHIVGNDRDPGLALSVLVLGPDACKAIGNDNAAKLGRLTICFGIAPALGAMQEGRRQFQTLPVETFKKGVTNAACGTVIGAIAEAHPLTMAATLTAGLGALGYQEFGPPSSQRNRELGGIFTKILAAKESKSVMADAARVKQLLQRDLFEMGYGLATCGLGIKHGQSFTSELKATVPPDFVKQVAKTISNEAKKATEMLQDSASFNDPRLAFTGTTARIASSRSLQKRPDFLMMTMEDGSGSKGFGTPGDSNGGGTRKSEPAAGQIVSGAEMGSRISAIFKETFEKPLSKDSKLNDPMFCGEFNKTWDKPAVDNYASPNIEPPSTTSTNPLKRSEIQVLQYKSAEKLDRRELNGVTHLPENAPSQLPTEDASGATISSKNRPFLEAFRWRFSSQMSDHPPLNGTIIWRPKEW